MYTLQLLCLFSQLLMKKYKTHINSRFFNSHNISFFNSSYTTQQYSLKYEYLMCPQNSLHFYAGYYRWSKYPPIIRFTAHASSYIQFSQFVRLVSKNTLVVFKATLSLISTVFLQVVCLLYTFQHHRFALNVLTSKSVFKDLLTLAGFIVVTPRRSDVF